MKGKKKKNLINPPKLFKLKKIGKRKKKEFNIVAPFVRILADTTPENWCTIMCNISPQVFRLLYECVLNAAYNSDFFHEEDREKLVSHMSKHLNSIYTFLHCKMTWFERQCCCTLMCKHLQYIFRVISPYIDEFNVPRVNKKV